jgi:hypothetical protein
MELCGFPHDRSPHPIFSPNIFSPKARSPGKRPGLRNDTQALAS